jgi:hypothetical protein
MSSLSQLQEPTEVSEYANWTDLRQALNNWAVSTKFTFRTAKKTPDKARYICHTAECSWCCNASRKPDGMLELHVTKRQHTCIGAAVPNFSSSASKTWVNEAVSQHLLVTKSTKPKEIENTINVHFAEKISYKIAQLCHLRLLDGGLGHHRYSFQLLPSYRDTVELCCPGAIVDLSIDQQTGNFQRCFVCPPTSQTTFQHLRHLIAADGTFLTGRFSLTLLLAVGIDANGQNVILA